MGSTSSFASEWELHEWEGGHPETHEMHEWEWEHPETHESHETHEWEWEHPETHESHETHEWEWEHPETHEWEWEHPETHESHETHEWEWEHPETHEWESHEWEWEHPETHESHETHEWEWEGEGEADPFLPFLLPLAAKALPMLGKAVMPAIRRLIPAARRAVGSTIRNILAPSRGPGPGAAAPAGAAPGGVACPGCGVGNRRQHALRLIRELHGIVLRGEAEAEAAEAALFGTAEAEWESGHPAAQEAALTEVLAAEAAHTASETEAEALLGAALPITIRIITGRRRLRRVTPALVSANARLVRGLRRSGPSGPALLRVVPKIQRNTVATIRHAQRMGRPVPPSMVAPIMAAQAARVLGTPHKCGPALLRNAIIRQRTVAPAGHRAAGLRHARPSY